MMEDTPGSPLRAAKRRKVFRRKLDADDDNVSPSTPIETMDAVANETEARVALPRSRHNVVKKQGISFSSNSLAPKPEPLPSEETALVTMHPDREQRIAGTDRFVKPSGKTAVIDDRHMTAFVDSKMAELKAVQAATEQAQSTRNVTDELQNGAERNVESVPGMNSAAEGAAASQRNKHQHKPLARTLRQPPLRATSDLARDSLIEDIMRESDVGLYDRSASGTPSQYNFETPATDADPDSAAALAFTSAFLREQEERNRRRPPNPAPFSKVAKATGMDRTNHGPKLGGSRAQRERMKAAQATGAGSTTAAAKK
ncbi:hypothetical protein BAUCODRAFT_517906 [Baudoinia panamericana UAMH 10762]|uniref:Uncharacterized protein n=1 Tax=Baudoinia panamericana (strain UAMH 10762) TaxID=717646 RepID=M2MX31_BAUPA|nr:uncharacterized protein BAUCODRAFT_517906 [Baudoinia panamericana UAMH 10762]EMC96103.1 hypothetical protein BAUCODRAFT_517906 [Baudoinia panamericana UAMH 10762]